MSKGQDLPPVVAEIAMVLGSVTNALELCAYYSGQTLEIPTRRTLERIDRNYRIRQEHAEGAKVLSLCRRYGMSKRQVSRIIETVE